MDKLTASESAKQDLEVELEKVCIYTHLKGHVQIFSCFVFYFTLRPIIDPNGQIPNFEQNSVSGFSCWLKNMSKAVL